MRSAGAPRPCPRRDRGAQWPPPRPVPPDREAPPPPRGRGRSRDQQELSGGLARSQELVCLTCLRQRKHLLDPELQIPPLHGAEHRSGAVEQLIAREHVASVRGSGEEQRATRGEKLWIDRRHASAG